MNKDDDKSFMNLDEIMRNKFPDAQKFRAEGRFFAHHLMAVRADVDSHSAHVIGAMTKEQQSVVQAALSVAYMMGAIRVCEPWLKEE